MPYRPRGTRRNAPAAAAVCCATVTCFRRERSRPGLHQPWFSISHAKSISAFITRVINVAQTELVYSARSDGQRRGSGGCHVQNPSKTFCCFPAWPRLSPGS